MYLYSLGERGWVGGGLSFMYLHIVQTRLDEEGDREEKGERNWKDTKGRVGIKSGGGRAIKGGEKSKRG